MSQSASFYLLSKKDLEKLPASLKAHGLWDESDHFCVNWMHEAIRFTLSKAGNVHLAEQLFYPDTYF